MEVGRGERWIVGSEEVWVLALLRDVVGEDGPSVVCQRGEGVCHWQQGRRRVVEHQEQEQVVR